MQKNHNEPEMPSSVFVALVGRPNVGKSSLTNHLVGEKVAIVTQKAQTTRNRITGIITKGPVQYVLPKPRIAPASPGPSSGCPSTKIWSCWIPPASISRATGWIPA